jgi:hypothetical protein
VYCSGQVKSAAAWLRRNDFPRVRRFAGVGIRDEFCLPHHGTSITTLSPQRLKARIQGCYETTGTIDGMSEKPLSNRSMV